MGEPIGLADVARDRIVDLARGALLPLLGDLHVVERQLVDQLLRVDAEARNGEEQPSGILALVRDLAPIVDAVQKEWRDHARRGEEAVEKAWAEKELRARQRYEARQEAQAKRAKAQAERHLRGVRKAEDATLTVNGSSGVDEHGVPPPVTVT